MILNWLLDVSIIFGCGTNHPVTQYHIPKEHVEYYTPAKPKNFNIILTSCITLTCHVTFYILHSVTRDYERWIKRALGTEHLSLNRPSAEGLKEGLLYWGPPKDMLRLWNGRLFPYGPRFWGTWRDALFLGPMR
jgi:hypothetical protein